VADAIEFWQGRLTRLHDRVRYELHDGSWSRERLGP
jgi:pyridoxine/pyridoxamine 5'-phosphate oxidase